MSSLFVCPPIGQSALVSVVLGSRTKATWVGFLCIILCAAPSVLDLLPLETLFVFLVSALC